jgi:hypothetical protein
MMQLVWRRAWRAQVSTTVVVGVRYYYVQVCSSARQVPAKSLLTRCDGPSQHDDGGPTGPTRQAGGQAWDGSVDGEVDWIQWQGGRRGAPHSRTATGTWQTWLRKSEYAVPTVCTVTVEGVEQRKIKYGVSESPTSESPWQD